MGMKTYERIEDMLCEELEQIADKPEMSTGDLDTIFKIMSALKDTSTVLAMDEAGYSHDGDYDMRGSYDGGYSREGGRGGRGGSRGGRNGGGYSSRRGQRRDSMGRYSRDGGMESMMEYVDMMMEEAPDERTREMIRDFKEKMGR